jgi:hypothetical protein
MSCRARRFRCLLSLPCGWGQTLYRQEEPRGIVVIRPAPSPIAGATRVVDQQDYFLFLKAWLAGSWRADLNRDGHVDTRDYFWFIEIMLTPQPAPARAGSVSLVRESGDPTPRRFAC